MENLQDTAAKPGTTTPADRAGADIGQAKETLRSAAISASRVVSEAYDQGEEFVRDARERYPEAERYYQSGSETVRHYARQPVVALLVGIALGVALHRPADRWSERQSEHVPDHARTR